MSLIDYLYDLESQDFNLAEWEYQGYSHEFTTEKSAMKIIFVADDEEEEDWEQ